MLGCQTRGLPHFFAFVVPIAHFISVSSLKFRSSRYAILTLSWVPFPGALMTASLQLLRHERMLARGVEGLHPGKSVFCLRDKSWDQGQGYVGLRSCKRRLQVGNT